MKGRAVALVIAAWALLNVALATLMFVFTTDLMSHAVYWAANVIALAAAIPAWFAREPGRRRIPEASGATLAIAVGLAFLALGVGLGIWAVLIGLAGIVLGVTLLALERWAR